MKSHCYTQFTHKDKTNPKPKQNNYVTFSNTNSTAYDDFKYNNNSEFNVKPIYINAELQGT